MNYELAVAETGVNSGDIKNCCITNTYTHRQAIRIFVILRPQ